MKLLRSILIGFLASFLVTSGAYAQAVFSDLSTQHPNYEAVNYLYQNGIVEGYSDGTFKPDQKVNRAEALKILLLGSDVTVPDIQPQEVFPDVVHGVWYAKFVAKAKNLGIVHGDDTTGLFRPGDTVNLAEALKMLANVNNVNTYQPSSNPYPDVPQDAWFAPYFTYAQRSGLLDQDSNESVHPATPVTRGLLAELMFRQATYPLANADGQASYYAEFFHGRTTANGETFDQSAMTAAHRDLPFDTWLRVTNVNNGKSVIVRINDRGPYADTKRRVIDLSKAAFEKIAPLSRGIIWVSLEQVSGPDAEPTTQEPEESNEVVSLSPDLNATAADCPELSDVRYIGTNAYEGFTLDKELPDRFVANQIHTISGQVNTQANKVTAFFVLPDGSQKVLYEEVDNGAFSIDLRFPETGDLQLGLIPGESGTSVVQDIRVFAKNCLAEQENSDLAAPTGLNIGLEQGDTKLNWSSGDYDLYKLTLTQGPNQNSYIIQGQTDWIPHYANFKDFAEGQVQVRLRGGNLNTKSLLESPTITWSPATESQFTATDHHFYTLNKNEVKVLSLAKRAQKNNTIQATIQPKVGIREHASIILPRGKVEDVPLTSSAEPITNANDVEVYPPSSQNLIFSYTTNESGTHFLEINNAEGLAAINVPLYPPNQYPLLPDSTDLITRSAVDLGNDIPALRNQMLSLINQDRSKAGLKPLALDNSLTNLAQLRSTDMAENNYFGHWDSQGRDANDLRTQFGIQQTVSENLAQDITIELAQDGLMRSAIHRSNILSENWTRVGIGISRAADGSYIFVQIFSEDPLDLNNLSSLREKLLNAINKNRGTNLTFSPQLNSTAQVWSEDMANRDFFDFTNPDGETLVDQVRNAGINNALGTYIMGNSSFNNALDQVSQNAQLKEPRWTNIGIGIEQDNVGIIKITLVYSE